MTGEQRDPFHPELHREKIRHLLISTHPGIRSISTRQLGYRPGRSLTASYTIRTDCASSPHRQAIVLIAARSHPRLRPVAQSAGGHPISLFGPADDPDLPGMATVMDPARLAHVLDEMRLSGAVDGGSLRLRSYRPLRRAVFEIAGTGGPVFLKVLRPHRADRLVAVATLLGLSAIPVPPVLGSTRAGVVVMGAVPGTPMRTVLGGDGPLPDLDALLRLLDGLPPALLRQRPAVRPVSRAQGHAAWLTAVDRRFAPATELAGQIADATDVDNGPVTAVHGDFYENNLTVEGAEIVGLIDVDGAGSGHRIDDLATMLGHLSVLGLRPSHRRAGHLQRRWLGDLDRHPSIDRRSLRIHVAAVVLGLATGCFRVQERHWRTNTSARLDLAARWLHAAERL